jgi:hypothetical protein
MRSFAGAKQRNPPKRRSVASTPGQLHPGDWKKLPRGRNGLPSRFELKGADRAGNLLP